MKVKPEMKITLIYLVSGILWILISDRFLLFFFNDFELKKLTYLQSVKGFFYVASTALLLFLLLRRQYKIINAKVEQLERYTQELEMSNKELEQFAYVASHDLQEPLRTIISFITKLETEYKEKFDERGKQYIGFAVSGAKRMRTLILDLLEYSKIGKEKQKTEIQDINQIVQEILLLHHEVITQKKAQIHVQKLPVINTDSSAIFQIFHQLIGNALKYTNEMILPSITIAIEETNHDWIFSVADNGIGIEKQYFKKIFLLFQRLHSSEEFNGNGIGLAIVKKNVDKLNGRVWVISEKDKGATFYFSLKKKSLQ
ncbi:MULTISPECIES: sensor histidine kinase [Flavobacterium]|uniref:histidine kinase n=1 Tax=Flavobacterium hankyongi TaxID=1176532 RepID=A0ABP9A1C9_9FLAO|nr:ATP-binding protein [Flavobacterium sp. N1846]